MAYEITLSKKTDKAGRAELLIRMRLNGISQRAKSGLHIYTKHVREESYISSKGRPSTRLVITVPRSKFPEAIHTEEVKKQLDELIKFIDEQVVTYGQNNISKGWLDQVIKSFFSKESPTPQPEEPKALSIFDYFDIFGVSDALPPFLS